MNTRKIRSSEEFLFYSEKLEGFRQEKKGRNLERQHFKKSENQLNTKRLFQVRECYKWIICYLLWKDKTGEEKKRQRKTHKIWKTWVNKAVEWRLNQSELVVRAVFRSRIRCHGSTGVHFTAILKLWIWPLEKYLSLRL